MKVVITGHLPKGGVATLYSVDREDGKKLVDNRGSLSQVYYGCSSADAKAFYDSQFKADTVEWY